MKCVAVVTLFCVVIGCSYGQGLRAHIDAADKAIHKLMVARDAKGFRKYMASEVTAGFKYVENGQTESFDTMCQGMADGLGQMKSSTKAESNVLSCTEKGGTGSATVQ
ncbi:MAG TPA: hypothetical protein VMI31_15960, partial [Fimbriimonadaceae bacterium]|nr:hypothetical protein [Fimbriimonadaceae bacterium]